MFLKKYISRESRLLKHLFFGGEGAPDYWGTLQIRTRPLGIGRGVGASPHNPYPTLETNKQTYQDISNTLIYEHICGDVEQEDNVVLKTNHLL